MALEKVVSVGGQEIRMRASALVPRLYRIKFGRDMVRDMNTLKKSYETAQNDEDAQLSAFDLTLFENISYIMARHADPTVPDNPDDWLDTIPGVFSIYEVLPQIMELWSINLATTSTPAKK